MNLAAVSSAAAGGIAFAVWSGDPAFGFLGLLVGGLVADLAGWSR